MDDLTKYYAVTQVAKKLSYTEKWVRYLIKAKQLRAVKVGKWLVKPEDLERFIKSRSNL